MKYLKKYESFYNEDFQAIKENFGKRESDEDEKSGDQGFDRKDNKSQSSDIPAEVETPSMSGSEGGSGHNTAQSSDIPKEVETASMSNSEGGSGHNTAVDKNPPAEVMTSTMESVEDSEGHDEEECEDENCSDCNDETEKVDEGAFRKFFTGHDSGDSRDEAMTKFHKELDEMEAKVNANPSGFAFNRASLEAKAKDNNYRGSLRMQTGGRDKSKKYVIYDEGTTGLQKVASGSGSQTLGK